MRSEERPGRAPLIIALCAVCLVCALVITLTASAGIVRVRSAEVTIEDLPEAFDGTRFLYISDIDTCGGHGAKWLRSLAAQLGAYQPEFMIVGGDLCAATVFEALNGGSALEKSEERKEALEALDAIECPMGKYMIPGEKDGDYMALGLIGTGTSFKEIVSAPAILSKDGAEIMLAGVTGDEAFAQKLGAKVDSGRCVITAVHTPEDATAVRISEAADGGAWSDLILCGHTHGGLVRVLGLSMLSLTDKERQYIAGWYTDGAQPMLVSSGLGTDGIGLRLGTQSEVWMITLKCPEKEETTASDD